VPDASKRQSVSLSDREEQVLRAIAWGLSNKEVAAKLGLSVKTVESYKAIALQKLGLRTVRTSCDTRCRALARRDAAPSRPPAQPAYRESPSTLRTFPGCVPEGGM
jgi:DNA-binding NarL/FixJ family response regulator